MRLVPNITDRCRAIAAWEWLAVIASAGLMVYVTVPFFIRARVHSQPVSCVNNLRQIDGAKEQWALETKRSPGESAVESEIDKYIKGGALRCPKNGTYTYGKVGERPRCTIANHTMD